MRTCSMVIFKDERAGVDEVELSKAVVDLVKVCSDIKSGVDGRVRLNVTSGAVDDVSDGYAGVCKVGVVVDNRRHVDGVVTDGVHTLVPVNVTSHVGVDVVLKHDSLESSAHVLLV